MKFMHEDKKLSSGFRGLERDLARAVHCQPAIISTRHQIPANNSTLSASRFHARIRSNFTPNLMTTNSLTRREVIRKTTKAIGAGALLAGLPKGWTGSA